MSQKSRLDAGAVAQAVTDYKSKPGNYPHRVYRDCNVVAQDQVFRQRVDKEQTAAAKWDDRWSYMTRVDNHGRPRTAPVLPSKWAFFDEKDKTKGSRDAAPHTSQREVGMAARNPSANVLTMRNIELTDRRARKKTDIGSNYSQQ